MWGKKNNNLGWYFQILCLQQHESLFRCGRDAKMHIYIQQTLLSKATDNKHICQKEKQQHTFGRCLKATTQIVRTLALCG